MQTCTSVADLSSVESESLDAEGYGFPEVLCPVCPLVMCAGSAGIRSNTFPSILPVCPAASFTPCSGIPLRGYGSWQWLREKVGGERETGERQEMRDEGWLKGKKALLAFYVGGRLEMGSG